MGSEVRVSSVALVKIIGYIPGEILLLGAMNFAVSLLEDGITIREIALTCIACRLSAPFRCSLWQ